MTSVSRRTALQSVVAAATAASLFPKSASAAVHTEPHGTHEARLRFSVIGLDHGHINGMSDAIIRGGGELVSFHAERDDLAAEFGRRYPQARRVATEREILEDKTTSVVMSSIIPVQRAPLGIRVMQHGKDFVVDKPGVTTLDQLAEVRRVQASTRRMYSICYSERFENRATVKAAELARAGAIGKVIQTVGLGPHRVNPSTRAPWFWDPTQYGGIICDIGSHQFDQFLYFTGSTRASVVASQVANVRHKDRPAFQDFGDVMVRGDKGTGYVRLDWFTPDGLPTWGDTRLTVLGTDGFMEIRKNVDLAGRAGGSHLYVTDAKGVRYEDCSAVDLPWGRQVVDDVLQRTETAMTQVHCFLATQVALEAQRAAQLVTLAE